MSKIAFTPNASGTGTFSIASPGTNTDRTLTLPDATGTVVLADATQTLTNKSIDATQLTGNVAAARITTALNASGSAPVFACRAWVNFNGDNGSIRASGNVSSVTYNGVGQSTVNFTTAMPDANYSGVCSAHGANFGSGRQSNAFPYYLGYSTGSVVIYYGNTVNAAAENCTVVNVAIFR
jgi:hypothetical protein